MGKIRQLSLQDVTVDSRFLKRYIRLVREKMIPYQWEVLNDCVPDVAHSSRTDISIHITQSKSLRGDSKTLEKGMNLLHEAFVDTMERALYNTVLSGISLAGTEFFYVNPLEVSPAVIENNPPEATSVRLKLIPYFLWANRGKNEMRMHLTTSVNYLEALNQVIYKKREESRR